SFHGHLELLPEGQQAALSPKNFLPVTQALHLQVDHLLLQPFVQQRGPYAPDKPKSTSHLRVYARHVLRRIAAHQDGRFEFCVFGVDILVDARKVGLHDGDLLLPELDLVAEKVASILPALLGSRARVRARASLVVTRDRGGLDGETSRALHESAVLATLGALGASGAGHDELLVPVGLEGDLVVFNGLARMLKIGRKS
ncbi:uncharacterized protein BKA78DRAFT_372515, partial [Phyllosticta capitalensis]